MAAFREITGFPNQNSAAAATRDIGVDELFALQPESINTPEGVAALEAWQPDLLVVAAYGQILSKDVLTIPERLVTFDDGGKKATVELAGPTASAPAKKVEIKTGISDGLNVEVLSGLKKGDRVIERPPKEIS